MRRAATKKAEGTSEWSRRRLLGILVMAVVVAALLIGGLVYGSLPRPRRYRRRRERGGPWGGDRRDRPLNAGPGRRAPRRDRRRVDADRPGEGRLPGRDHQRRGARHQDPDRRRRERPRVRQDRVPADPRGCDRAGSPRSTSRCCSR
ncbi:hypothetical protein G5V59_18815 [Nocardioides sp. W3-2-3]|uniref:hypothetical protein n=1 Tax=Nocardioides convexus TaxID=2712224 RepID=UPI002418A1C8|nr:hypothetical protein [Nocardioides convexus]NHA01213.1 hypothetical protein [Nocardioides convexus]